MGGPTGERVGEAVGGTGVGEPGEKALDVAVAVGPPAPREERESIPAVAAEIPGATQSDHRQKEQGQEERAEGGLRHALKAGGRRGRREGLLEGRDVNADGVIDAADLELLVEAEGLATGQPGFTAALDPTGDGRVDAADRLLVQRRMSETCPQP